MNQSIHVWHLEITDAQRPEIVECDTDVYALRLVDTPLPEFSRFLYVAVGASCLWYMRLPWSYDQWRTALNNVNIQTWVAYRKGTPIGYFELEKQPKGTTEICYFGLLPEFIGQGFGKKLLADAIAKAWSLGGNRVWLHTCSLDHPSALQNYLSRGFTIFNQEDLTDDVPDKLIQPWPNANRR